MDASWKELPEPARGIARALTDAVAAARAGEPEPYAEATTRLAALDGERVGLVAGETVRLLLEDLHPDGLDADDLRAVLTRCAHAVIGWFPALDVTVLTTLIAGALGVHESEGQPIALGGPEMATHAPLLIADLVTAAAHPLPVYLGAALSGIATTQRNELP